MNIFLPGSRYTRQARSVAIIWTLLIFIGCLTPAQEIPKVEVPFIDKWTHLVMFGGFTFLWCCARPALVGSRLFILLLISLAFGCLIEVLQGTLSFLGRSMDLMDVIADALGGAVGIGTFCLGGMLAKKKGGL